MNNYCTNCGKPLSQHQLKCNNCDTLVVDIPCDYYYVSPEKKKRNKTILITLGSIVLIIIGTIAIQYATYKMKINKMKKEYVIPYINKNYKANSFDVEFNKKSDCIISGECYYDPVMGCDGGVCEQYEYVEVGKCESYHYNVKFADETIDITVVKRDGQTTTVEGPYIYGKYSETEPYESGYIKLEELTTSHELYSKNNGDSIYFFVDIENEKIKVNFAEILEYIIPENISVSFYDEKYKELFSLNEFSIRETNVIFETNENTEMSQIKYLKVFLNTSRKSEQIEEHMDIYYPNEDGTNNEIQLNPFDEMNEEV